MCCLVLTGSPSSELGIEHSLFFWNLYSLRNILLKFQNFSQSVELVGNQFNRWLRGSLGFEVLCIVSVGSPSSELRIERRLFFWIHYSLRNLLVKFQIFYQPVEPVGKRFNRFC